MFTTIRINLNERAVVLRHGLPVRALGPGKHRVWGSGLTAHKFVTDALVFQAPLEIREVLPGDWFDEVLIGPRQRGLLYRDAVPVKFLRPGLHRYWTVDGGVALKVVSVDEAVPEMTDELAALVPKAELVDVTVRQFERGLFYVQGRFARLLEPGRHAFWSHAEARAVVTVLDVRGQQITIPGQELMTRDKVTLRLTMTAEFAPTDPPVAVHTVADVKDALYLAIQLAARDYVAGVTLDELLEGRDGMTRHLEEIVVPKAREFGVEVRRVGVKDVVLPGEMKTLLNRVIEAEKEAAANVILRREEASATRSMANTAKVIADNPVLMELKRLEALTKVAEKVQAVKLVLGADRLPIGLRGAILDERGGDDD